mmetsp:Transcript_40184/g.123767  ORF Transcript_40184/g.123767 Transcript_40184/m.123767 type:complete len:338 (-) Transcript_40184:171-1184(-)
MHGVRDPGREPLPCIVHALRRRRPHPVQPDRLEHRLLEQRAGRDVLPPGARKVLLQADGVYHRVRRLWQRRRLGQGPQDHAPPRLVHPSDALQGGAHHDVRVRRVGGAARAHVVLEEDQPAGLHLLRPRLARRFARLLPAQLSLLERVRLGVGALVRVAGPLACEEAPLERNAARLSLQLLDHVMRRAAVHVRPPASHGNPPLPWVAGPRGLRGDEGRNLQALHTGRRERRRAPLGQPYAPAEPLVAYLAEEGRVDLRAAQIHLEPVHELRSGGRIVAGRVNALACLPEAVVSPADQPLHRVYLFRMPRLPHAVWVDPDDPRATQLLLVEVEHLEDG